MPPSRSCDCWTAQGLVDDATGQPLQYHDTAVIPIIDNTPREDQLTDAMAAAMRRCGAQRWEAVLDARAQLSVGASRARAAPRRVRVGPQLAAGQGGGRGARAARARPLTPPRSRSTICSRWPCACASSGSTLPLSHSLLSALNLRKVPHRAAAPPPAICSLSAARLHRAAVVCTCPSARPPARLLPRPICAYHVSRRAPGHAATPPPHRLLPRPSGGVAGAHRDGARGGCVRGGCESLAGMRDDAAKYAPYPAPPLTAGAVVPRAHHVHRARQRADAERPAGQDPHGRQLLVWAFAALAAARCGRGASLPLR